MADLWRNCTAAIAIIGVLLQTVSPAFADDVGVLIHPFPLSSGVESNSTASRSFDWNFRTFDLHDTQVTQFYREPLGASSGAEPGSAPSREGSGNKFDPLALALGVLIMSIIGLSILHADDSGSPV